MKPPLPPKNGNGGSANHQNTVDSNRAPCGTPVATDYEICNLLQKQKNDVRILDKLIKSNDDVFKNQNHFVLHSTSNSLNVNNVPPLLSGNAEKLKKTWRKFVLIDNNNRQQRVKPDDSGYLSSDSSIESKKNQQQQQRVMVVVENEKGSESDESSAGGGGDGHSESGAESVETHSVFFGRFHHRKQADISSSSYVGFGSMDSGVDEDGARQSHGSFISEDNGMRHGCGNISDSEPISYMTVVSLDGTQ